MYYATGEMLRVGLTGGIACGKSAVSQELRSLGVPVIDADELARRVVEPGQPAFDEILSRFGEGVLAPDGCLDRAALGRVVFDDPEKRSELEAITHPRIALEAARDLARFAEAGEKVAVYEVPLLFEVGLESFFDVVVVVAATRDAQIRRLWEREGLDAAEASARLNAQMPTEEKVARADEVVHNNGALDELRGLVRDLHERLTAMADDGRTDG